MKLEELIVLANKYEFDENIHTNSEQNRISFVKRWPIEKLKSLTVEEYADTSTKDCFIYWLERKKIMAGIGGGSAAKFGIYLNQEGNYSEGMGTSKIDLEGKELNDRLSRILVAIVKAIDFVRQDDINKLDEFVAPIWNMVLNKILIIYFPDKFLNIAAERVINAIANDIGIEQLNNYIVTNYLIREKLNGVAPFSGWNYRKISDLIWDIYNPKIYRNYYIIGSKYGGHNDVFPQMMKESVISTGFIRSHNLEHLLGSPQRDIKSFIESIGEENKAYLYLRYFLNLKPGDWIAIKSDGSPKGSQPYLSIVGLAEVVEDENFYEHDPKGLGQKIKVKFLKAPVEKEFSIGGYGSTMHKITKSDHIDLIFYSDYGEVLDEKGIIVNRIIRKYKDLIRGDNNKDELYKWEAIKEFQELWNIDAPDISTVLKQIKFYNLIYHNSFDLFNNSEKYPEEARAMFEELYNEEVDLKVRITNFQAKANEIFRKHLPGEKPYQEERAIATYLAYKYPDKYSYYKSSFYDKFVKLLGEIPKDPGEKFIHYLEIINDLKNNYILKDDELIELSDNTLTDNCYEDKQRNILAQDILYRVLDQSDLLREYTTGEAFSDEDEVDPETIPLNLILYGPPGTGKTFYLRNYYFKMFTSKLASTTKEDFYRNVAENLSWWQIISVVVLDLGKCKVNDIFNHPLLQAKLSFTIAKTPKNTIWSVLQSHTKSDCPNVNIDRRFQPQFFWKEEDGNWTIDKIIVENETPEITEVLEQVKNYNPKSVDKKRYIFTTFHQAYSYEDFVEGIKPILDEDVTREEGIAYKIVPGIFKKIVQSAKDDPDSSYALFIDEINRGNIANIFGELITLIEDDKRAGSKNELTAILPYSKEEFSVPNNLHIIGTMNTADRSVEALDTALRRRFSFLEMHPKSELIQNHPDLETDLQTLLTTINQRIEKLVDKDHRIGHSYFMEIAGSMEPFEELKKIFATRIVPLLNEYFYGDPVKIGTVLGENFIMKKDSQSVKWPKGYEPDELELKEVYEIADPLTFEDETPFIAIYES